MDAISNPRGTLLALDANSLILLVMGIVCCALALVLLAAFSTVVRPWLQAFLSGCAIPVMQIIGMRMRQVDVGQVIRCGIMATQAGVRVPWRTLESAYLQRIDLEKVTLAYIESHRAGEEYSFDDLVAADRRGRLDKLLGRD